MIPNCKNPQKSPLFFCNLCYYTTCNKKDYGKHLQTKKHLMVSSPNQNPQKSLENPQKTSRMVCSCGKTYLHKSTLSAHKKKCLHVNKVESVIEEEVTENSIEKINSIDKDELINYLLKENSEFKQMLLEQNKIVMKMCENNTSMVTNNSINSILNNSISNNSNNKTFNLNVFLNEQCKDAMNIMEFVDSVKLQLSDLESVGKLGFVEGISKIIIKNLNAMDICKRPLHCSDEKREVIYVKDDNKWEKENDEKGRLRKAIQYIAHKNTKILPQFKEKHPDCIKSESKYSEYYSKLIIEAMGGIGNNESEKENKIIRNITKEILIPKKSIL